MRHFRTLVLAGATLVLVVMAAAGGRGPLAAPACQLTGVDRVVAVGDVHGAYDRYVEILRTTGLLDDRLRWTGGRTHLVQLGDVVDRGPDSLKALDLLERLEKDAARAGGAVHALLGNHEVMRIVGDVRFATAGEYEAFTTPTSAEVRNEYVERAKTAGEPASAPPPLGFVEMRQAFGRNGRYGRWLRSHDAVVQIDGVVFVHGGISPAVAGQSCDAINEAVRRSLTGGLDDLRRDPTTQLATRVDGPLWYRGLAEEPETFAPTVDDILSRQNARAIVVGHTVTADRRVRARFGAKVIQIDTGMQAAYVPDGRASALEISRGVMSAVYTDRREVIVK
jgi:hypothetical protein